MAWRAWPVHFFHEASRALPVLACASRITLGAHPLASTRVGIETDFEWMRIARSDDAILRKDGAAVGLLAQPEFAHASWW
jgi:hypothetical protein